MIPSAEIVKDHARAFYEADDYTDEFLGIITGTGAQSSWLAYLITRVIVWVVLLLSIRDHSVCGIAECSEDLGDIGKHVG